MTPEQLTEKAKEIIEGYLLWYPSSYVNMRGGIVKEYLATPEAQTLIASLVEGWKKDEPKKSWEELRDLFKSNTKIPAVDRSILHFECFLHGYEEGKKSST